MVYYFSHLLIESFDRVEDGPFEEEFVENFEEEPQDFAEEGKWCSPSHVLFDPMTTIMLINISYRSYCINLMGTKLRMPSLFHLNLDIPWDCLTL